MLKQMAIAFALAFALLAGAYTGTAAAQTNPYIDITNRNNATFYPLIKDGYKEETSVRLTVAHASDHGITSLTYEIVNVHGKVMTAGAISLSPNDGATIRWDGSRDFDADTAPEGAYLINISASDPSGEYSAFKQVEVRIDTKKVTQTKTIREGGSRFDSKTVRGNCQVTRFKYDRSAYLDCWAGRYAEVRYGIRIPEEAKLSKMWIGGEVGCCDNGQLMKSIERVAPTRVAAKVRVTNWRAYTVNSVNVRYSVTKHL